MPQVINRLFLSLFIISICLQLGCQNLPAFRSRKIGISFSEKNKSSNQELFTEIKRELALYPEFQIEEINANGSLILQKQQIQQMLSEQIDLLLVESNNPNALSAAFERAHYMKVPIIVFGQNCQENPFISTCIHLDTKFLNEKINSLIRREEKFKSCHIQVPINFTFLLDTLRKKYAFHPITSVQSFPSIINPVLPHTEEEQFIIFDSSSISLDEIPISKIPKLEINFIRHSELVFSRIDSGKASMAFLYPSRARDIVNVIKQIADSIPNRQNISLAPVFVHPFNQDWTRNQIEHFGELQRNLRDQEGLIRVKERVYQNFRLIIYLFLVALIILIVLGTLVFIYFKGEQQINDILEAKNQEILEQKNRVQFLAQKAEKATHEKFRFFTNISHEFRTPLTLILAPVNDWLKRGSKVNPRLKKDLELIRINSLRLMRLVSQLIDFRKIEHGKMTLTPINMDIVSFLREVKNSFDQLAKQQKINLEFRTKIDQLMLQFDPDKLDKVFFNLLSNAFKFTDEKGSIVIEIKLDATSETCIINISDNGSGMSEKQIKHIFDRFYQGRENANLGSGLGLALSKELVELHNGKISVESQKWNGTKFSVFLPTTTPSLTTETLKQNKELVSVQEYQSISSLWISELDYAYTPEIDPIHKPSVETLLIIEDHPDLSSYLSGLLGQSYHVISASNGNLGLALAQKHIPDLILCDIDLPGINGYEVLEKIKLDKRTSHIPIIIITVHDEHEHKLKGLKGGADDYISKPFNVNMLLLKIKNLLNARRVLKERYINELDLTIADGTRNQIDKQFVNEFITLVNNEAFDPEFGVEFICKELGMSRIQLYRKTKALIGYGVKEYINNVRLKRSKYFLKQTDMSMAEIAEEIGFSSASYFGRVFRTKYNLSPSEYRNSRNYYN